MRTIQIHELLEGGRDFDLFRDTPSVDAELVRRGLFPPLPAAGGVLVWGFACVDTALKLGIPQVQVLEVEGDEPELLETALRMEQRRDGFSLREKAAVLNFLKSRGCEARAEELSGYIQSQGSFVKPAEAYLGLGTALRGLLDADGIDLKTAAMVSDFSDEILSAMTELLAGSSFSRRRLAFRWLYEISVRDGLQPDACLDIIRRLKEADDPSAELEQLRYPHMKEMEQSFEELRSRILKGSGITLTEPSGFEGGSFSVSFDFRSRKQLRRVIDTLGELEEIGDELFSLLW